MYDSFSKPPHKTDLYTMNAKYLLALAIVAALVVLVTPYYVEDDLDEVEKRDAMEDDFETDDLALFLQKRGRGLQYNRKLSWRSLKPRVLEKYLMVSDIN